MQLELTPLRLLVFDRTCVGRGGPGLSDAWRAGGGLYRGLGRLDAVRGVASWGEAFAWLRSQADETGRPIGEVQFWGHGRRGRALVDRESFDPGSLASGSPHFDALCKVRERFVPRGGAGLWFRTCETLGGHAGHDFALGLSRFFEVPIAGHTHVIGFWQSGLHSLRPGEEPHWPTSEGVGASEAAVALDSSPLRPHTIHCLQGRIPPGW